MKEKKKFAVFFIGIPGSGKSSIIKERFSDNTYKIISADEIKRALPGFDPKHPDLVHEESVRLAEEEVYLATKNGFNFVMDSGGVNNSYQLRIMNFVKDAGYVVALILVDTPLSVCLQRNSTRERNVPADEIIYKSFKLPSCFEKQKAIADYVEVIKYYTDKNIFFDMDGVLAEYQTFSLRLSGADHKMDYINSDVFAHSKPVAPVLEALLGKREQGSNIYILSVSPNSICSQHKREWLKTWLPQIKDENICFVGKKEHKVTTLLQLMRKHKIAIRDCTFVDDLHEILWEGTSKGINAIHPSKFLAEYYNIKP